jgi:Zn-dependent protease
MESAASTLAAASATCEHGAMPDRGPARAHGITVARIGSVPVEASAPLLAAGTVAAVLLVVAVMARSIGLVAIPAGLVCFVGSFLAHEGAHAIVARAHGLHVTRILLRVRGGMTVYARGPLPAPAARVQIATAGPLASAALATSFAAVAFALGDGAPGRGFFETFAAINLFVTAVNLLPAPSLDGGQILAAAWDGWRVRRTARRNGVTSTGAT